MELLDKTSFIQTFIDKELTDVQAYLQRFLQSDTTNNILAQPIQYILQAPGKQIRTRLVFLVAGAYGAITPQTRRGAALVSLIHQASLIHDDVIDEANQRRGMSSVNTAWGNKKAVLIGDYILTKCIGLALEHQDYILLRPITLAVQEMIDGELLQLEQLDPLSVTEEVCLKIIYKKTASLMAACCVIGIISSCQVTNQQIKIMRQLGEHLGMAFQIQDDLLDYGLHANLNKSIGMDIKGQKVTLPLFYALQQVKEPIRQEIIHKIKHGQQNFELIQEIIDFVHHYGGIKRAQENMYAYKNQALQLVEHNLLASPYKYALVQLLLETIL